MKTEIYWHPGQVDFNLLSALLYTCKLMLPVLLFFCKSNTKLFINGQFVESSTDKWIDIHNPVSTHNCLVKCSFELLFLLVTQGWAFTSQYLGKSIVGLSEEKKTFVSKYQEF